MSDRPMQYGQYCPVSRAVEVLCERWSLLILRDVILGTTRFNELARGLPGLSRSLLAKRLRAFERDGLLVHEGGEYRLTPAGRALEPVVFGIGAWGAQWAFGEPRPDELEADVLVWRMHRRLDTSGWPGRRHVIHLRFSDDHRQFWVLIEDGRASVCLSDPGFEVQLHVTSDVRSLYEVWLGRLPLAQALRSGRLRVDGAAAYTRTLADVLRLSPAAPLVIAADSSADCA